MVQYFTRKSPIMINEAISKSNKGLRQRIWRRKHMCLRVLNACLYIHTLTTSVV